jgi:DNA-binding MarR family transcriptional regulator
MMRRRTIEVNPLSSAEINAENVDVLFVAGLVSRSTTDLVDTALAAAGLTGDEFAVYSVLSAGGSVTPGELARWMAAPPTTVSSYVKRFEARGHITRTPDRSDRRSYRIRLTAAGRRTHRAAVAKFTPVHEQVLASLGDSENAIRSALIALRSAVDNARAARRQGAAVARSAPAASSRR